MLKGINPLLGPDLLKILRAMGHGDEIAVVDANYPADTDAKRLVRLDGIDAPTIVDAILSVMPLDDFVEHSAFRPGIKDQPDRVEPVMTELAAMVARHEPSVALVPLQGDAFYARVKTAYALVASGERRLYGNIVLRKGVVRPD
jgi:L-fucose mutarotase